MDRSTRGIRKEIVDGQQRIKTIVRFHEDGLSLPGESKYAGKRFSDLDEEIQNQFVSYTVSVDVIRNATSAEILQMFRRMNAYTLPLNEPQKRHRSEERLEERSESVRVDLGGPPILKQKIKN